MANNIIRVAQIMGKWNFGGVEAVIMNYYRYIDKSKVQFDFICDEDSTNIPYEEIKSLGGQVILVPPYSNIIEYQKKLFEIFNEKKYKIVHSNISTLSVFPLRVAKKANIPIRIAHCHSTSNKKEWKKDIIKNVLRPFSKRYATHYVACSELAGRYLFGDKTFNKGEVLVLNNAIDINRFRYDENIRRKKRDELGIENDALVIGHIGRFAEQKNHRFLIHIFYEIHKKKDNSILLLAGNGPLQEEIKNKVKELRLDDSVIFLGQRNDVDELYQVFDIFLLPSLYEGLPVVGVEAQAMGILCFFSQDTTKETKILDSTVFISLEKKSNEWAEDILNLKNNFVRIDRREEISSNGFNIEIEAAKLEKYYEGDLDEKN